MRKRPRAHPSYARAMSHTIEHVEREGFFIEENGERIAELTYEPTGERTVIADHTWVSDQLRGQGIARKLLDALVAWARESNTRVKARCSYIVRELERDPSIADVIER